MANIQDALDLMMQLDGAIAIAFVDLDTGKTLGTVGRPEGLNVAAMAAEDAAILRGGVGQNFGFEDILITLSNQYHLIRPAAVGEKRLFLYCILDKARADLPLVRQTTAQILSSLEV